MFLNDDLRNRLQPHAIPSTIFNITNEDTTTQNKINETSTENSTKNIAKDVFSVVAMCSITNLTDIDVSINSTENVEVSNNDHQTSKIDKITQTELKLSSSTPRKISLRRKLDAAEKRVNVPN